MASSKKKKRLPADFEGLLERGDLPALQAVFDACDVNARGGFEKQTALAFWDCPDELARWLVARGADLGAGDARGLTPLHARADRRQAKVDVLLELGADVNATDSSKQTPLHAAAFRMNVDAVAKLLGRGADVDAHEEGGLSPLELALRACPNNELPAMVALARLFLDAGAKRTLAMRGFVEQLGTRFDLDREINGNGGANWYEQFREMARAFLVHLGSGSPLSAPELATAGEIVDELVRRATGDLDRMGELAVAWVLRNANPVALSKPTTYHL